MDRRSRHPASYGSQILGKLYQKRTSFRSSRPSRPFVVRRAPPPDFRRAARGRDSPRPGDRGKIGRAHVELQSLMRISYAVFCLKKKKTKENCTRRFSINKISFQYTYVLVMINDINHERALI